MTRRLMITVALSCLVLAGCARKAPPAGLEALAPAAGDAYAGEGSDPAMDALQSALASTAGDRVFFALDSHTLAAEARETLVRQAVWLRQHPQVVFTIEGHCDERGTRDYNLALGDRRARAAADFLVGQGISPSRITTISYGKERPEALGSDDASWAQNRRAVSIVVRNTGG